MWNKGFSKAVETQEKSRIKIFALTVQNDGSKKRLRSRFYCVLPIKTEEAENLILIRSVTEAFTEVCKLHMIWKAVPENLWFRGFSGTECFYATPIQKLWFYENHGAPEGPRSMIIVHACTMIIVHACHMIIVHACSRIIVCASTMIIVLACTIITVRACTMIIVYACTMIIIRTHTMTIVHARAMIVYR